MFPNCVSQKGQYVFGLIILLFSILPVACQGTGSSDSGYPTDDRNPDDTQDDDMDTADDAEEDFYIVSNGAMEVTFEKNVGHIVGIKDLKRGMQLLDQDADRSAFVPFSISTLVQQFLGNYQIFEHGPKTDVALSKSPEFIEEESQYPGGRKVRIHWGTSKGWAFEGVVEMDADGSWADFTSRVETGDKMIYGSGWPILFGLNRISGDGVSDRLALPVESGMEIKNPIAVAAQEIADHPNQKLMLRMQYPDGHSFPIPVMAYYSKKKDTGFVFYARDPEWTHRFFSFYPFDKEQADGLPTLFFETRNWDADGAGGSGFGVMDLSHPLRIEVMDRGDWPAAAEIYRNWIEKLPVGSNSIGERDEDRRRLYEKMSVSVFGLSSSEDQSEWMRVFHDLFTGHVQDDGVLFVTGWDFHPGGAAFGGTEYAFYQGGRVEEHWLPFQGRFLDMADAAHARGDLVFPFYYDLYVHDAFPGWSGWSEHPRTAMDKGAPWIRHSVITPFGLVNYAAYIQGAIEGFSHQLCASDPVVQDFYLWRADLLRTNGVPGGPSVFDGFYHDITGTVALHYCYDRLSGRRHGHPGMGWGRFVSEGQRYLLEKLNEAGSGVGQENATEPFFDVVDFSHLGLPGDGPYRMCESGDSPDKPKFLGLDGLIMDGRARQIPFLEYVNHAFGPLRTGGKVQISEKVGDAWYWVAAYNYVYGGILELIYFNTAVDLFDEIDPDNVTCPGGYPCAYQTGWIDLPEARGWFYDDLHSADAEKIAFLQDCQDLRLRLGGTYLTAGEMLPPPTLDPEPDDVSLDYNFYAAIAGDAYEHFGTFDAAPIIASAFTSPNDEEDIALFAANVTADTRTTSLVFEPARYRLPDKVRAVFQRAGTNTPVTLGDFTADGTGRIVIPLTLPAHSLGIVKLRPA